MTRDQFVSYCEQYLGRPYIWGRNGPDAFDCSGYAQWVLNALGIDPPADQSAQALFDHVSKTEHGTAADPGCGCLVFYGAHARGISHVAVCLDSNDVIEAGGGGRSTTNRVIAWFKRAKVRIRQLDYRPDRVDVLRPKALPW